MSEPVTKPNTLTLFILFAISCSASCYRQHEASRSRTTAPSNSPARVPARVEEKFPLDAGAAVAYDQLGAIPVTAPPRIPTQTGLKVAVFGDQGVKSTARAVLQLIAREHADMVIHLGDLSYDEASPAAWEAQVDSVLGPDFPYFVAIGNHDVGAWFAKDGFASRFQARLSRMQGAHCEGEYAINASCTFRGLHFVLSGIGTYGRDHEQFLRNALENSTAQHNLCAWHKNQGDMQVGGKVDEVGWQAYQICAAHGVPVITGHEHSYSRTYTLSAVGDRSQRHGAIGSATELLLGPGRTFVVVSGLGGESTRVFTPEHRSDTWWASIYANNHQVMNGEFTGSQTQIEFGVLFITYGADGDPSRASAYFKTASDIVADQFSWRSEPTRDATAQ